MKEHGAFMKGPEVQQECQAQGIQRKCVGEWLAGAMVIQSVRCARGPCVRHLPQKGALHVH
jgi:hypothetical protein